MNVDVIGGSSDGMKLRKTFLWMQENSYFKVTSGLVQQCYRCRKINVRFFSFMVGDCIARLHRTRHAVYVYRYTVTIWRFTGDTSLSQCFLLVTTRSAISITGRYCIWISPDNQEKESWQTKTHLLLFSFSPF